MCDNDFSTSFLQNENLFQQDITTVNSMGGGVGVKPKTIIIF